jgi:hypothetical protein
MEDIENSIYLEQGFESGVEWVREILMKKLIFKLLFIPYILSFKIRRLGCSSNLVMVVGN